MSELDPEFIRRCTEYTKPQQEESKKASIEQGKKWRLRNPEKQKEAQRFCDIRRRMRKFQSRMILSLTEREEINEFYRNRPPGYEVDHIIPIAKGGSHTIENLQYLIKEENREKQAKWIGVQDGEVYDPDFLIKRLNSELEENCQEEILIVNNNRKIGKYKSKNKGKHVKYTGIIN